MQLAPANQRARWSRRDVTRAGSAIAVRVGVWYRRFAGCLRAVGWPCARPRVESRVRGGATGRDGGSLPFVGRVLAADAKLGFGKDDGGLYLIVRQTRQTYRVGQGQPADYAYLGRVLAAEAKRSTCHPRGDPIPWWTGRPQTGDGRSWLEGDRLAGSTGLDE